jgi:hypothetical protein
MITSAARRRWIKAASLALAAIPIVAITGRALATFNAATRAQLKYQDHPLEGKSCSACLEFIPGKTEADLGGCKKIPDDNEISPNGYCTLWNTM